MDELAPEPSRREWLTIMGGTLAGAGALGGMAWHRFAPETVTEWRASVVDARGSFLRSVSLRRATKLEVVALRGPGMVRLTFRLRDPAALEGRYPATLVVRGAAEGGLWLSLRGPDGRPRLRRVETRAFAPAEGRYEVIGRRDGEVVATAAVELRAVTHDVPLS